MTDGVTADGGDDLVATFAGARLARGRVPVMFVLPNMTQGVLARLDEKLTGVRA